MREAFLKQPTAYGRGCLALREDFWTRALEVADGDEVVI